MQQSDGALGVNPELSRPGWATPYAILVWQALGGRDRPRWRAAGWLIDQRGGILPGDPPGTRQVLGHDPTLVGWPWVAGTHSWLEPTALSILALQREGLGEHPRLAEGTLLLRDRALPHGGWNYGNKTVFGRELRPQPGPTGLALVALSARKGELRPPCVDPALAYLQRTLPEINSLLSLGWGVLGLRAWRACPREAETWLAQAYAQHGSKRDAAMGIGLLLLAGSANPFGLEEPQ
jgi:hypothetical protein